jgi:hypothetical protein
VTLMSGFYINTSKGFSKDQPHYITLHIGVCVKGEFEDQGKWAILC